VWTDSGSGGGETASGDPVDETESGSDGDSGGGLPAWLWGIIGATMLAAVGAAAKIGPFSKKDDGSPEPESPRRGRLSAPPRS
jgi:hypothetical protein